MGAGRNNPAPFLGESMKVTNSTDIDLGFAQYVIAVGESMDVDAAAADWFCRHGCTSDSTASKPALAPAPAPADAITDEIKPRRRRSRRD